MSVAAAWEFGPKEFLTLLDNKVNLEYLES